MSSDSTAAETPGEFIKTDRLGRIHLKTEHREALLDKFEQSGMSGREFAKLHGLKYTTFANWRQQRRIKLNQYPKSIADAPCELINSLAEVVVQSESTESNTENPSLQVDLGGGVNFHIRSDSDLSLATKLINHIRKNVSL